ncbi:hypothetical protein V5799_004249 [Amblyomma americanum]|uniref:Uncharacterized protein n=1 Tax=Amblyomma americanum TaxID=6943 RepID=A0AAQ4D6N0_AMBAM
MRVAEEALQEGTPVRGEVETLSMAERSPLGLQYHGPHASLCKCGRGMGATGKSQTETDCSPLRSLNGQLLLYGHLDQREGVQELGPCHGLEEPEPHLWGDTVSPSQETPDGATDPGCLSAECLDGWTPGEVAVDQEAQVAAGMPPLELPSCDAEECEADDVVGVPCILEAGHDVGYGVSSTAVPPEPRLLLGQEACGRSDPLQPPQGHGLHELPWGRGQGHRPVGQQVSRWLARLEDRDHQGCAPGLRQAACGPDLVVRLEQARLHGVVQVPQHLVRDAIWSRGTAALGVQQGRRELPFREGPGADGRDVHRMAAGWLDAVAPWVESCWRRLPGKEGLCQFVRQLLVGTPPGGPGHRTPPAEGGHGAQTGEVEEPGSSTGGPVVLGPAAVC